MTELKDTLEMQGRMQSKRCPHLCSTFHKIILPMIMRRRVTLKITENKKASRDDLDLHSFNELVEEEQNGNKAQRLFLQVRNQSTKKIKRKRLGGANSASPNDHKQKKYHTHVMIL